MLEEYDALAAETASEEDENAARLECRAGTGGVNRLADLMRDRINKCLWIATLNVGGLKHKLLP